MIFLAPEPTLTLRTLPLLLVLALIAAVPAPASASGVCTGTSADAWVDYASWNNDVLEAEGAWKVVGASSARLRYYVDGVLFQTSYLSGSPNVWYGWTFEDDYTECGSHTFKVEVCPRVWDSGGYTICETHCDDYSSTFFTETCSVDLNVTFDCSVSGPNGVVDLDATITSGNPPYQVEKFFPTSWYVAHSSTNSTSHSDGGRCSLSHYRAGIRITDSDDQVETRYCWCSDPW